MPYNGFNKELHVVSPCDIGRIRVLWVEYEFFKFETFKCSKISHCYV